MLDDYEDPVSHTRSMAAFAPVGGTGLIVVVAMPKNALDAITQRMTDQIKAFLWGAGVARPAAAVRHAHRAPAVGAGKKDGTIRLC
jgi:hypothetical protein